MDARTEQALDALARHLADGDYGSAERVLRSYAADRIAASPQAEDASSYRLLADGIAASMADPDTWDGDGAEVAILLDYVAAMPAMVLHQVAEMLREKDPLATTMYGSIAYKIDPFRHGNGQWFWVESGVPVPERMLKGVLRQP